MNNFLIFPNIENSKKKVCLIKFFNIPGKERYFHYK